MSTHIELRAADFRAPGRPVLTPMSATLSAAFRPYGNSNSLIDLTGNGHSLSRQGAPIFTDEGVRGDKDNYYVSDIPETVNMSMYVVMRVLPYTLGGDSFSILPAGNFDFGPGIGLYIDTPQGASGPGFVDVVLKLACPAIPGTVIGVKQMLTNQPTNAMPASEWIFVGFTVSDTAVTIHLPKTATVGPVAAPMAGRTIDPNKPLKFLGAGIATSGNPGVEVAAVGLWSTAIATAEMQAEYARVKAAFASSRPGITDL